MADRKQPSSKAKSRKTVRKPKAGYTLEADDDKSAGGDEASRKSEVPPAENSSEKAAGSPKGEQAPDSEAEGAGARPNAPEAAAQEIAESEAKPENKEPQDQGQSAAPAASGAAPAGDAAAAPSGSAKEEEPAVLLRPRDIDPGDPEAAAPPPGPAPPGDSRSFRRRSGGVEEFCLIYRSERNLVSRSGVVGKNGTWSVVEYPSIGAAAHAYAQQCSELSGRGFRDLTRKGAK